MQVDAAHLSNIRTAPGAAMFRGVTSIAERLTSWAGEHDIIPLYMKGRDIANNMVKLTHREHVDIHSLIDTIGRERYRIPKKRTMGRNAVRKWLEGNNELGPAQMRATLMEAYGEFDRLHPGKDLLMRVYGTLIDDTHMWLQQGP